VRAVREYLLVFLAAAVVSYLLCVFARELAMRTGAGAGGGVPGGPGRPVP
jgi:hypothetical protein